MFSIAAINDTDSKTQWEPLAPTKEAQEFHLTQNYHEGLQKLQARDYEKARELLEAVLKDPLISTAQVESTAGDSHLLQLKFLALKNLASVFLQQGSAHHENALNCYLQAVEIDAKDSVVWNQLGTLACSMGILNISRWAFEQGLVCSPNNWNCMEKLLEVLIAIGDEVACLSVAELILQHWPSHARALHVKSTIEDPEPVPFAPKGIDKLEPKHVRLTFGKRKASDSNLHDGSVSKKLNETIKVQLIDLSWTAVADLILGIFLQKKSMKYNLSERIEICLPSKSGDSEKFFVASEQNISVDECSSRDENISNKKVTHYSEEQIHERRSSRLESLRSQKTGKEETAFCGVKDMEKVVFRLLQPFIIGGHQDKDLDLSSGCSLGNEWCDVQNFVLQNSNNRGAYHLGHLLLEEVAKRDVVHSDAFMNFLELEKMTRLWNWDRTPECDLFLGELYYDWGSCSSSSSRKSEFMLEALYHLGKIIGSVVSDWPTERPKSFLDAAISSGKSSFWVRFYWLSGLVSMWEGNRPRAHREFSFSLSFLENNRNLNDKPGSIQLPHCKVNKALTTDKIRHQIYLLEVQLLLDNGVAEMLENEEYLECIALLAPLLLSSKGANVDVLLVTDNAEGFASGELTALDLLVKACEKAYPLNMEVYLSCQKRKLQILMVAAGMQELVATCEVFCEKFVPNFMSSSGTELNDGSGKHGSNSIAQQVKEISECSTRVKNYVDQHKDTNDVAAPGSIIADIQTLLLALMCNIAKMCFCKKPSGVLNQDQTQQEQQCLFVNAAIAFCKLQHLERTISIKAQVELIVTIHEVLAEYGLCCFGKDGEGVDGTFLKLAIKHLLALDMKLKSDRHSVSNETKESLSSSHIQDDVKTLSDGLDRGMCPATPISTEHCDMIVPDSVSPDASEHENVAEDLAISKFSNGEQPSNLCVPAGSKLTEDEREELESEIDDALNQCFFCLYGLNLRSDSMHEDDLAVHRNTCQGDYQSKEQSADVFKYILPYAKASNKSGLLKLRRVLRAIRKHFPQPPDEVLAGNPIDKYLDDPMLCEDKLSEEAGSSEFLESLVKIIFPDYTGMLKQKKISIGSCEPYLDVYSNLYYLLAQSEEPSVTDKWPGFVLTKEGEDFVEQRANLCKYDLLFNPLRFESWQRLANVYDEEVDLLLNDGSKNVNVAGWRKNPSLSQRVENSRRRSRRCLMMSLALAKTSEQQSEIHELLALVYYDGLQNVAPFYDQRLVVPIKDSSWMMFCKNSKRHFEKAFDHRKDWLHAFYLGKLCEKLGCAPELSFSYYGKATVLNPSAVDAIYRMHASRLKLLYTCQKWDIEALKVSAVYSFKQTTKETALNILDRVERKLLVEEDRNDIRPDPYGWKNEEAHRLDDVWHMLYSDCLSGLELCAEGDLKHFHKARYMLAQGLYRRGEAGDLYKAKDEMAFCFKSSRSSFTINMWEIDSTAKKGRRKAPAIPGSKKVLEVNLPESSRKFISCLRKYLQFYLKLLEETGDVSTLDRAYVSIRADKRFSLCLEDLVPIALGRLLKTLVLSLSSVIDGASAAARSSPEHTLEKMFTLFMEQGSLWPDVCNSPEIECPELKESSLYGCLHQYLYSLEKDVKLEVLEAINDKIRKRCRNPKLSNSFCTGVFKHASVAWCRSLIINLVLITPIDSIPFSETNADLDNNQLLCVHLQTSEFWNSSFGDTAHLLNLETKWHSLLSKVKHALVRKTSEENLDTANSLLRSAYSFYRDSSSIVLTSGINLFWVPSRLAASGKFQPSTDGVEIVDMSVPRKLLLWAYTLLHGRCPGIAAVVKYCEENIKTKAKKSSAGSSLTASSVPTVTTVQAAVPDSREGACDCGDAGVVASSVSVPSSSTPEAGDNPGLSGTPSTDNSQKIPCNAQQLKHSSDSNTSPAKRTFDLNDDAEPERS